MKAYDELGLTQLEKTTMIALISLLYAEPGYSDVDANDLSRSTKIPTSQIRGVLSSLVKKGIIDIEECKNGRQAYQIIYLRNEYYYLHPRWAEEIAAN